RDIRGDVEGRKHNLGIDGRVLNLHLSSPTVRCPVESAREQVHPHTIRAGRHNNQSGYSVRKVSSRLHFQVAWLEVPSKRRTGRARTRQDNTREWDPGKAGRISWFDDLGL